MTAILVDSNVILDVFTEDPKWSGWSAAALAEATETAQLVINPIVYAEVSIHFLRIEDLDVAFRATGSSASLFRLKRRFWRARYFWTIADAADRAHHRFPISSSAPTRRSPAIDF